MKEISETGFWNGETAHIHHVYSKELGEWIYKFFSEKISTNEKIIDFGCGMGNYLQYLSDGGFTNLLGYEGDPPKNKVFSKIIQQDLTIPFKDMESGNVICLEVGEHIDKKYQDILLDNITNNCDNHLITSWAVRGQDGFGHVNCLDNHEVLPLFEQRGFKLLEEETKEARSIIQDYCWWFRNTLFIMQKV